MYDSEYCIIALNCVGVTIAPIHSHSADGASSDVSRCFQISHDVISFADVPNLTAQRDLLSQHWWTNFFDLIFLNKSSETSVWLK